VPLLQTAITLGRNARIILIRNIHFEEADLPTRKRHRLQDYDYSQEGVYFITVCAKDRQGLFGKVVTADHETPSVELFDKGEIVSATIKEISAHYDDVIVDKYVIMPNHIHLILFIDTGDTSRSTHPTKSLLSAIVTALKKVTNKTAGSNLWQASFYDHVIRDEAEYQNIWQYIDTNPLRWADDRYYYKGERD